MDEQVPVNEQKAIDTKRALLRKKWDELTDSEKIERLRDEVIGLRRQLSYMTRQAKEGRSMAENHEHGSDGQPMFRAHVLRGGIIEGESSADMLA